MRRIEKMVSNLRRVKAQKASAGLVRILASHNKDLGASLEALETVRAGLQASREVFGKKAARDGLERCANTFSVASKAAKRVAETIRDNPERAAEPRVGDGISDIKASAKEGQQAIKEFWSRTVEGRCELALATADIATLAGSKTSTELEKRVKKVRALGIPSSQKAVRELAEEFEALEKDVSKAGVPDAVRRFIESARQGTAEAKALEDGEVRRFLDKNALWARITVRLT